MENRLSAIRNAFWVIPLVVSISACPEFLADDGSDDEADGGGGSSADAGLAGEGGSGGSGGSGGNPGGYPMPDWEEADPEQVDVDLELLAEAGVVAESLGSHCLLVVRDGKLVFEKYANGAVAEDLHNSGSMGMAFTSTLVGIMLRQGVIGDVDDLVSYNVPEWVGTDKELLTLRHFLTMTPGLEFGLIDDARYIEPDEKWTEDALDRAVAREAGTLFEYSHMTAQVFEPVIRNATGADAADFARQYLFGPLGFGPDTTFIRNEDDVPALFGGVMATCRDMARLGYLVLRDGAWEGKQIVDSDWIATSILPDDDSPNQAFNNYFWLNGPVPSINAVNELQPDQAPLFSEAPFDLVMAMGTGGNFIDIRRSTDTVIVHLHPLLEISGSEAITNPEPVRAEITADLLHGNHRAMWDNYFGPAGL